MLVSLPLLEPVRPLAWSNDDETRAYWMLGALTSRTTTVTTLTRRPTVGVGVVWLCVDCHVT